MIPLCIISDKFQFICLCIPKNASSSLGKEFKKSQYQSYECQYDRIGKEKVENYFSFALLRDSVTRLLSAYQEISLRQEMSPRKDGKSLLKEDKSFYFMDDTMEKFHAFLEEVQRHK
ncbi:MAG: sulfotransferase family 2 domain-containing protein [Cytophagales bacterium]|nr:sulfotransferase family 2 domain-containing protein [Cytophagales bacterium]